MTEEVTNALLSDIQECFENISIVPSYGKSTCEISKESCESSSRCSDKEEASTVDYVEFNCCSSHKPSDNFMCLNKSEQFLNSFRFTVSKQKASYFKKNVQECEYHTFI